MRVPAAVVRSSSWACASQLAMLPVVAVVSAWLLLAEPQSSSTSTMMELAEMANLLGTQDYPCRGVMHQTTYGCWEDGCYPRDHIFYPLLTHSDVCEIIPLFIDKYISSKKIIYKNHITPTEHNKKWVLTYARRSQKPVVILTRDVYDAVHGFCERWLREGQLGVGGQHVIKNRTVELHETLASFQAWSDGWTAFARAHPKHARVITFEAMMAGGQREAVLSSALEFWGIPKVRSMSGVMARYVHAETSRCDGILMPPRPPHPPPVPPIVPSQPLVPWSSPPLAPSPAPPSTVCPAGYEYTPHNLDGHSKQWFECPFSMLALHGSTDEVSQGECITSPTTTATADGTKIAAQCCTSAGDCRRSTSNSDSSCIAGVYGGTTFVSMTFEQTRLACVSRGLELCKRSCTGKGCQYNGAYVWSGLSCGGGAASPRNACADINLRAASACDSAKPTA